MPGFNQIDWDKVAIPQGSSPEQIQRTYENAIEDLVHLAKDFDRHFANKKKKARVQMLTDNIFAAVNDNVTLRDDGIIDVEGLLKFVTNDDRPLFRDICTFAYEMYHGKPMNDWKLRQFRGLLTYFLCKAGF